MIILPLLRAWCIGAFASGKLPADVYLDARRRLHDAEHGDRLTRTRRLEEVMALVTPYFTTTA